MVLISSALNAHCNDRKLVTLLILGCEHCFIVMVKIVVHYLESILHNFICFLQHSISIELGLKNYLHTHIISSSIVLILSLLLQNVGRFCSVSWRHNANDLMCSIVGLTFSITWPPRSAPRCRSWSRRPRVSKYASQASYLTIVVTLYVPQTHSSVGTTLKLCICTLS